MAVNHLHEVSEVYVEGQRRVSRQPAPQAPDDRKEEHPIEGAKRRGEAGTSCAGAKGRGTPPFPPVVKTGLIDGAPGVAAT